MIISRSLITSLSAEIHSQQKRIVFTNGCFDILHVGHATYLSEAKKLGDILIVGVNSDASVRRLKGEARPLNNENDRTFILDSLKSVDIVTIFNEDTPLELITLIKPNIIVKGGDYNSNISSGVQAIVGAEFVRSYGGSVVVMPFVPEKSTTRIIAKIQASGKASI